MLQTDKPLLLIPNCLEQLRFPWSSFSPMTTTFPSRRGVQKSVYTAIKLQPSEMVRLKDCMFYLFIQQVH